MQLRDYQTEAIDRLRKVMSNGKRRVILQAACGAGKTIISSEIASLALEKGKKVLFLVNRRDLVKQTVEKYREYGLEVGVIMAGEESNLKRPIQVASLQTYSRRLNLESLSVNPWFAEADLVIHDECHSATAKTYKDILDLYKERDAFILGLSATPARSDGTGLGTVYQDIVQCVGINQLITDGHLVPMVYYAPSGPDLSKLRVVAGDYEKKELGNRVDKPKLIGDIYDNWARICPERQTIIFAVNVKHSLHIKEHFERRGVRIEHIDAHTPDDERAGIYARFEGGDTQVLTNVGICTEGSDFPFVSCVILARPTKSLVRFFQMAGRGMRPDVGVKDCILLDHAGCISEHGLIEDPVEWGLSDKEKAVRKKGARVRKPVVCSACANVFYGSKCPMCGTLVVTVPSGVAVVEGDLVLVGKKEKFTRAQKEQFYRMLEWKREQKNYKPGWVGRTYKVKFGVWPRGMDGLEPMYPDDSFNRYMKHLAIKWAKRRVVNGA